MRESFLFSVILALGVFSTTAQQAITITNGDMPDVNDNFRFSICDNLLGIVNLNDDGPDQTWNYSTLGSFSQRVDEFVDPVLGTPLVYNVTYSNIFDMNYFATLAAPNTFGQFGGNILNVTEVYDFYRETNSFFANVGLGLTINGIPLTAKMSPRDKVYEFPLEYGDEDDSFAQFGVEVPQVGYYGQKIWRTNTVDAWGEISTRYGTFEALRVTTVLDITDTISLQGFGFEQAQPTTFEVKWFAKNIGVPVLTVKGQILFNQEVVNTIEYLDSLRDFTPSTLPPGPIDTTSTDTTTAGIGNLDEVLSYISASPNPFTDGFVLHVGGSRATKISLSLMDISGREVESSLTKSMALQPGSNTLQVNADGIRPGIYQLVIADPNLGRKTIRLVKL